MTYCLGIITESGIVMASDSRTNAGVDYISTYLKLFDFSLTGERVILISTSGNLSITQWVITELKKDLKIAEDNNHNLHTIPTLYEIARYVGGKIRQILEKDRSWLQKDRIDTGCSILLGGQIKGQEPELFLIYAQGNCISATKETPFLQIGETKYGKPILDRALSFYTSLEAAAKCALVSIDSTMKSNLSVGPPINLIMYEKDTFEIRHRLQMRLGDPYLAKVRKLWEVALKEALDEMPDLNWSYNCQESQEDILID
ncbi:MAG: proteasome-type protease [Microcoleaceae cyanobacterium MO_207.B10]|nr:proteasome-type protease [Microcoleaceae cyanobacterium MO_207.B10]